MTEFGWQTSNGFSTKDANTRINDFIGEVKNIPDVYGLWIYELEDSGINLKNGEDNYGVFKKDFTEQKTLLNAVCKLFFDNMLTFRHSRSSLRDFRKKIAAIQKTLNWIASPTARNDGTYRGLSMC